MRKNYWKNVVSIGVIALALSACGDGSKETVEEETPESTNTKVSTTDRDIFVPEGVTVNKSLGGDFNGAMIFAGQDVLPPAAANVQQTGQINPQATTLSSRDMAGFIAQRPAPLGTIDASTVLSSFESSLTSSVVTSLTSVGTQTFAQSQAVLSNYTAVLATPTKPTALANSMIQAIGIASGGSVTNLVTPLGEEQEASNYRIYMAVIYIGMTASGLDEVILLTVVVPEDLVASYGSLATGSTSSTNVVSKGATLSSNSNNFTGAAGNSNADFLFVIDDSGSMSNEQTALGLAADAFATAITNSGLNYNLATITTSDPRSDPANIVRDTDADGAVIADNDLTEFKADVQPGTRGSSTETGIFNAEHVLQSIALGDVADGFMTSVNFPRAGSSVSVLIFSDEPSQYTRRSGGLVFDPVNNLFVDRGYAVHAIVDENDAAGSQYDDLADNTGGLKADIGEGETFQTVMQNIAQQAGGAASQFTLTETPVRSTIQVTVAGSLIDNNASNGWTYVQGSNSIAFHGSAIPAEGQAVEITYNYEAASPSGVVTAVDAKVLQ